MNIHNFNIKRHEGKEWRVFDEDLARSLEYPDTSDGRHALRKLIRRHEKTLKKFNVLATVAVTYGDGSQGGRPGRAYWLTEIQAMYIAGQSGMPKGTEASVALHKSFEAYRLGDFDQGRLLGAIAAEILGIGPRPWELEYSTDFRDELHRVGGWSRGEHQWNSQCAQFLNTYVYGYLYGDLGKRALCEANPMEEGRRVNRHHQMLKEEQLPKLRQHIEAVRILLSNSISLQMFDDLFNRAFKRKNTNYGFLFDEGKQKTG